MFFIGLALFAFVLPVFIRTVSVLGKSNVNAYSWFGTPMSRSGMEALAVALAVVGMASLVLAVFGIMKKRNRDRINRITNAAKPCFCPVCRTNAASQNGLCPVCGNTLIIPPKI